MAKRIESGGGIVWESKLKIGKSKRSTRPYGWVYVPADLLQELNWKESEDLDIIIIGERNGKKNIRVLIR